MPLFEGRAQPLAPRQVFIRRLVLYTLFATFIIVFSLGVGIVGYHYTEGLSWIDSLLNASMLLGGMGPVDPLRTVAGKLFASFYALFSGVVFLVAVGVLIAPVFHRVMHSFHLAPEDMQGPPDNEKAKKRPPKRAR